jgi:hypothetical protein
VLASTVWDVDTDVWGPVLGTVVGGLIAALVAWRTTVSQWRRQRLDRRHVLIER